MVFCSLLGTFSAAVPQDLFGAQLTLSLDTNRVVQIGFPAAASNQWHEVQVSTNLLNWTGLGCRFSSNSSCSWVDRDSTNSPGRFYRAVEHTPLDSYVSEEDTNYTWRLVSTIPAGAYTTFVLEMVSQAWLTRQEVDRPLWSHWLVVTQPTAATNSTSLLFITDGYNGSGPPSAMSYGPLGVALHTHSVVGELHMVPNQTLTFADETTPRAEDAIIAYSWDKFLRTQNGSWPAQLAMTKAAVRAMDTISNFCHNSPGGQVEIQRFVVSGISKRGWTTWLTAAVDKRVCGIVPMVIDMLNTEPSMIHHYQVYGGWAPAIHDYIQMHIMDWLGTTAFHSLLGIVDPYTYRARLTMPKFLVNASGDEFFVPDSSQFYFDALAGVKYLRYVPNASHDIASADTWQTVEACYQSILTQETLPQFSWGLKADGALVVKGITRPAAVKLWSATNPVARDFRLATIGPQWASTTLQDQGGGLYVASVPSPTNGWTAFFGELTFDRGSSNAPFKFTTQVYVVPDQLPFLPPNAPP